MVQVSAEGDKFVFNIKGWHKFWALTDKIAVDRKNITNAYQDEAELRRFSGLRVGTHIPFLITAGTYFLGKKTNFWDMSHKKNTIIVELQNHGFNKLYVEVENPETTIHLLNSK